MGPEVAEALNLARTRFDLATSRRLYPLEGGVNARPGAFSHRMRPKPLPGRENPGENLSSARIMIL